MLHDAPLPPWPGQSLDELASRLAGECEWLLANNVLPADLVTRNRRLAETALRPWTPVAGYGTDVDLDLIHAGWSLRCLTNVRWLAEHGYGSPDEFPEVAVLRSRL